MKFNLLKNTAYIAIISCSLALGGCTSQYDEDYDVYAAPQPTCLDNNGVECVLISDSQTALYLPEFSKQTYTVTTTKTESVKPTYYGSQNGTDLSISAPTPQDGSPVRIQPIKKSPEVTIEPVVPATVKTPKIEPQTSTIETTKEEVTEKTEPKTVQTKTVQTKTVEIEEETKTAVTTKDTSLSAKSSYGEKCHDWEAKAGETLRGLLMQWAEKSGWTVIWKLDRDYHLEAGVIFRGTFTEVSGALIRSFARATPAPIGTFYKGNRVLVINTQEDENAN